MAKAESVMSPTAKRPLLQMRNITKRFGNIRALNGVDLDIYTGEIHALMGENGAGKSTLMKILSGAHKTTSGEITVDGQSMLIAGPRHAKELGISIIYQELSLAPNLTVAENMLLGREITHGGVLNRRAMSRACNEVLEELGVVFSVDDKVGSLSLAQQQQVEIARALLFDCRILVMDEPTTSLSSKECDSLFELIRKLRKQGMAIIYISHRMSEIYDLSDRVTVLRDGKYIGCIEREDLSEERLVQMMVGRDLSSFYEKDRDAEYSPGRKLLSITDIADDRKVHGVSLDVHAGEILGLAGIVGAGRTELARLIYGADRKTRGTIALDGRELDIQNPQDALEAGIVYLTEDRKHEGLFLDLSVSKNININAMGTDSHLFGILNSSKGDARTAAAIDDMQIAVSGPQVNVGSLSGGNQQKVLLARLLQNNPQVLILDEPTRGVDIGAKSEIYRIIEALAATGTGVIVISSELPELIGICDRIIIMREGIAAGEVGGKTGNPINSEGIIATATGSSRQQ